MGVRALLVAGTMLGAATAVQAQSYRFDLGVNGGYSIWSSMLDEEATGSSSVKFKPGWLAGAQATWWVTPRLGIRANFTYSDRGIDAPDGNLVPDQGEAASLDHFNIWNGSGDLLLRLRRPSDEFRGGEWLPYVAVGAGARWINPAGDRYRAIDFVNDEYWDGVPFTVEGGTRRIFISELSDVMFLGALGSDVRLAPRAAVRLEVGDRISRPYIYEVQPFGGTTYEAPQGRDNLAGWTHEFYGQLGLHLTLGGAGRVAAPVAVAPQAPPRDPPPPPPPAPAEPQERAITVCVIDPAAAGGVRSVNALLVGSDTLVAQGNDRVAFRTTVPNVALVSGADWFVAGRPLELQLRTTARYLGTGAPVAMSPGRLTLLGTAGGMHVYAEASAVSSIAAQLQQLNASGAADLAAALRNDAQLRTAMESVRTLYVPSRSVGCMFQPLVLQEEVRKSGS